MILAVILGVGTLCLLLGFCLGSIHRIRQERLAEEIIGQRLDRCGRLLDDCTQMWDEQAAALDRAREILDNCARLEEERQAALDEARIEQPARRQEGARREL